MTPDDEKCKNYTSPARFFDSPDSKRRICECVKICVRREWAVGGGQVSSSAARRYPYQKKGVPIVDTPIHARDVRPGLR